MLVNLSMAGSALCVMPRLEAHPMTLHNLGFSHVKDHEITYPLFHFSVSSNKWYSQQYLMESECISYWDHNEHCHYWSLTQKPYRLGVKLP